MKFKTVEWNKNSLRILDQKRLPQKEVYLIVKSVRKLARTIMDLSVRGAPAIGITAAYGVALSSYHAKKLNIDKARGRISKDIEILRNTRPTAINLFWALNRMEKKVDKYKGKDSEKLHSLILKEAKKIHKEDEEICEKIGKNGAEIVPDNANILTHCNAGALATGGWGTALGVIYVAHKQGKKIHVYAGETRPLLQGARLTVWELQQNKIPTTLLVDSARASLIKNNKINLIIVGADRIAANGDTANKIGTYPLALLAKKHKVKFYVAAPSTTFDLSIKTGKDIPIEERDGEEVRTFSKTLTTSATVDVYNPAFDVTPNRLITGIITEKRVLKRPFTKNIKKYI